ncbi:MAG: AAA family ATPase, partial [Bryobacteraceae bacterium]
MFGAIVLIEDAGAAEAIEQLAIKSRQVTVYKTLDHFPSPYELNRILNTYAAELVFIDVEDWKRAQPLVEAIRGHPAASAVVGYGPEEVRQWAPQFADGGVGALLTSPLSLEAFQESLHRAIHKALPAVEEKLLAFLPGKAGSGATTLALNIGGAVAEILNQKVLIMETDLNSGVLSVLMHAKAKSSIRDLLEHTTAIDFSRFASAIINVCGVDILLADPTRKGPLPGWTDYFQLLQFALPRYQWVFVDMPEMVNDATVEVVRRARSIYAVVTPELP